MRYLTVTAEYMGTGLKDKFEGSLSPDKLNLPVDLEAEIFLWNEAYQAVIPMNNDGRCFNAELIKSLDNQGLVITRKIKEFVGVDHKIEYYSEGLLRHLVV